MNIQRSFCLSLIVACGMLGAIQAQQSQGKAQKTKPAKQASQPYLLGPGDIVEVTVFGQQDLNSKAQVDADGNLSSLPFLNPIPARCRSERELQKDIAVAYSRLVTEPQISVQILE